MPASKLQGSIQPVSCMHEQGRHMQLRTLKASWEIASHALQLALLAGHHRSVTASAEEPMAFSGSLKWAHALRSKLLSRLSCILLQAGAITGFVSAFVEGPIDFFKSQIQVQIIRSRSDPNYKRRLLAPALHLHHGFISHRYYVVYMV